MKTKRMLGICIGVLGFLVCAAQSASAGPMGTGFTYEGHLYDVNQVANGLYDFLFKLYDANVGGSKVGTDVNIADVNVIDGHFMVVLDFGSGVFDGNARWLEIGVRPGEQSDPCEYTILEPRQEVTPTPYALYAKAAAADSDWTVSDSNMYSAVSGNVGVGTDSPGAKLEVNGDLKVGGAYKGNISSSSGSDGAPFPRPAYDSGWLDTEDCNDLTGKCTFYHNIGGDVNDYVIEIKERRMDEIDGWRYYNLPYYYDNLTSDSISALWTWDEMRVRIWVYK